MGNPPLTLTYPAAPDRHTWTTDSEWHALRQTGLGGSDAAAIAGLNRYRGPYSVWAEKTARHVETVDSEAVRWGTLLEPVILAEWAERHQVRVEPEPCLLQSHEWPWMLANVDGLIDGAIVEVKTAGLRQADRWQTEPPIEYWTQGLHYCAVTGFRRCVFVCLIGGQELVEHTVDYSEASIDHLVRVEADFWRHVQDDIPPPASVDDVPALMCSEVRRAIQVGNTQDAYSIVDRHTAIREAADRRASGPAARRRRGQTLDAAERLFRACGTVLRVPAADAAVAIRSGPPRALPKRVRATIRHLEGVLADLERGGGT